MPDDAYGPGRLARKLVENDDATFQDALEVYNTRSLERSLEVWALAKLRDPARHRLYRAITLQAFVLDDHDERVRVR